MNTNHKIFKEIKIELHDAIKDAILEDNDSTYIEYYLDDDDSIIEVETFCDGKLIINFYPKDMDVNEKDYPNIREGIEAIAPDWDDISEEIRNEEEELDEWQSHGFRDASDYYNWKFGNVFKPWRR